MPKLNNEEVNKYFESLRPDIERLIRKVDSNPHACITGIVFSQSPPCLMHLTSLENRGEELIKLHLVLSTLVAEMQDSNNTRIPFREFGVGKYLSGQAPEELADELARMVLVTGMDESRLEQILQLAQNYILARRPSGPDKV